MPSHPIHLLEPGQVTSTRCSARATPGKTLDAPSFTQALRRGEKACRRCNNLRQRDNDKIRNDIVKYTGTPDEQVHPCSRCERPVGTTSKTPGQETLCSNCGQQEQPGPIHSPRCQTSPHRKDTLTEPGTPSHAPNEVRPEDQPSQEGQYKLANNPPGIKGHTQYHQRPQRDPGLEEEDDDNMAEQDDNMPELDITKLKLCIIGVGLIPDREAALQLWPTASTDR